MMTIGDIKAAALQMMGVEFKVDGGNVSCFMDDDNYGTLIFNMVMALNRGLADLEAKRVLPLKVAALTEPLYVVRDVAVFSLDSVSDMFTPARLEVRGEDYIERSQPFSFEAGRLLVYGYDKHATYELYYHGTLTRVSQGTPDTHVLPIPTPLAEALPYFIKAEVFRKDEPGEANEARNFYEAAVAGYAGSLTYGVQGAVLDVFAGVF